MWTELSDNMIDTVRNATEPSELPLFENVYKVVLFVVFWPSFIYIKFKELKLGSNFVVRNKSPMFIVKLHEQRKSYIASFLRIEVSGNWINGIYLKQLNCL